MKPVRKGWTSLFTPFLFLTLLAGLPAAHALEVIRGPYLNRSSTDQITVKWRTDERSDSVVRYGLTPEDLDQTRVVSGDTRNHRVVIQGLSPDTTYYYAVGSSGQVLEGGSPDYRFQTHPPVGAEEPTRIWIIGDSGTANSNARNVYQAYLNHEGSEDTDVWLMLGDNAYDDGTDAEYQRAMFDMYPELLRRTTVWSTLGNHDGRSADSDDLSGPYYDIFSLPRNGESGGVPSGTEAYYSFDFGNIHFVNLDSDESDRSPNGAMLRWLENDLASTTQPWIIAFWHHPPYSKGSHDSDREIQLEEMRENALPILERYGVDLVFSGHSHSYERSRLINGHYGDSDTLNSGHFIDSGDGHMNNDGPYMKPLFASNAGAVYTVAGASGKISGVGEHPVMESSLNALGSVVVDVNGNRLDVKYLGDDGRTLDAYTMIKGEGGGDTGGGTGEEAGNTVERRIASGMDDVEERADRSIYENSSDIELVADGGGDQTVGLRFTNLNIPQGATITNAYVQFTTDETNSGTTFVTIQAQDADDAPAFTTSDGNVSDRPRTSRSADWQPRAWDSRGEAGGDQRTPDLSGVIQEVVSRSGWRAGNALALIIEGAGERTAESYEGSSNEAALLHVEYVTSTGGGDTGGGDTGSGGGDAGTGSDPVTSGNTLGLGRLNINEFLESSNGDFRLFMQGDGNLVLRNWNTREALWSSGTNGSGAVRLSMQGDGNLVLYTDGGEPVWASNTNGTPANRLTLNNDGSLGLYDSDGNLIWSVNGGGNTGGDTGGGDGGTDDGDGSGGGSGGDTGGSTGGSVSHLGSTADYDGDGNVDIDLPANAREGDTLLLFLSRTDDLLPIQLDGWTAGASCFKTDNGQSQCHLINDCTDRDGDYCQRFDGGNGQDLATVVFHRTVSASENSRFSIDMRGDKAGWAILSAVRGADARNPIRDVATESNDGSDDSLFPSVFGEAGDMLMLSQAFDDTTDRDDFLPPDGMERFRWIAGEDEAGYVFGETLASRGETGSRRTRGPGGPPAKDALIALTVRAGTESGGDTGGGDSEGDAGSGGGTDNDTDNGPGDGWTRCADENGFCDFSGTREVAYGADGVFARQVFTDGVQCTNGVFGDPVPGVVKSCWHQDSTTGGDTGGGTGEEPVPDPGDEPGSTPEVDEVSRANGILVGGPGSSRPGFTLYVSDNDQGTGGSTCTGACAQTWLPLQVGDSAASGISSLGTITRPDGSRQATFNGRPLYFFAQDSLPGETRGDGVNGNWHLAEGSGGDSGGDTGGDDGGSGAGTGGDTPTAINSLRNESMGQGERLFSSNGEFRLTLQGDGNLVLRNSAGDSLWSSRTNGDGATRLSMQSDGNLVLYTDSGEAVWASGTSGTGADRAVLNNDGSFAIYANGAPVWAVNGDGLTGDGGSSGGGGTVGDIAAGQTAFSSPDAALYSLNDSERRVFPEPINTGFSGNGHTESWDGRIIVVTRSQGWFAAAMRPERITRNADGTPDFRDGFFGNRVLLEADDEAPDMQHNWIAMVPDNAVTTENPYPSDADGNFRANGSYATYKAIMYHTSRRNGDNDQVGIQRATFIIRDANTPNAEVVSADFTSEFQRLSRRNGQDVRCIEMSVTMDGRLIVCQGHPDNNGRIDNLVYSWNPTPNSLTGWTAPRSLADMYYVDRNTDVAGVPFRVRFPIAEFPIRDASGTAYRQGDLIKGAYPWISHDGAELFYQASREGVSARRTATSVVGRWTGGMIRHIDGPINSDRSRNSKLFLSSPGAFTTMWEPYKDVEDLAIPYSVRGPAYPIIGSNTQDYSEVDFDDYLDGNYVLALGMNEQIDRAGNYQVNRTPDTSGHFNNGTLEGGAAFPQEFNGNDRLEGRFGQGIYFPAGSYLSINKNAGWESLQNGVTVDFFVRRINAGGGDIRLFDLSNGLRLSLDNGSRLTAVMEDESGNRETISGGNVGSDWTHVAFRFDPDTGGMALFVNGRNTAQRQVSGFGNLRVGGQLRIGPVNSDALLMLDEVHVSNVARADYEIGHNAFADTHDEPSAALANAIPEHLASLRDRASNVEQFSFAAAELGERLFSDVILSRERTTSCATCHQPGRAFTDAAPIARGNEPTDDGERNAPMLQNRLFSSLQGWGGAAGSLDSFPLIPIAAEHEMNLPIEQAVQRLRNESDYAQQFNQAFGEQPDAENLARALASFQALQFSARTRVDEFRDGNRGVLTASERRGFDLFFGKARCSGCHSGDNYTDESFRHTGLAQNGDPGRARQTGRQRDEGLFKVPSLRSVAQTAPYMHDGSVATLRGVVELYNEGAVGVEGVDTDIRPLELSDREMDDLVAFLNALSGDGATEPGSGTDPGGDNGGNDDSGVDTGSGGDNTGSGSDPVTASNTLGLDRLNANEFLESSNGDFRLFMQGDGNLVLRDWRTMEALWSSGTNGSGAVRLSMQGDGNLVLYDGGGNAVWASNTAGTPANRLTLNNDGSLGLYDSDGNLIWSANAGGTGGGDTGGGNAGGDTGGGDAGGDNTGNDDSGSGSGSDGGTGGDTDGGTDSAPGLQVDQLTINQPGSNTWHSVRFDRPFAETPILVMGPPSFNGAQPTTVRVRNVTPEGFQFQMDEWDYLDGGHTTETLSYLAVTSGEHDWAGLTVTAGSVDGLNHDWSRVAYGTAFSGTPVVLTQQVSSNGGQATSTRLRNVGTGGFEVRLQEEEGNDGAHVAEQVHFVAIETGAGQVAESRVIAGTTGNQVTHGWHTEAFGASLDAPRFFARMQTFDGPDTAALRYRDLSSSRVDIKVEEEQSRDSETGHTTENVGWLIVGQ